MMTLKTTVKLTEKIERHIALETIPSSQKHLKPLLQNIVYPEAINEIQTLTDAYDAERLQETTAAGGLGAATTGGLGTASSELLAQAN